jgi:hypothetical protein
MVIGPQSESDQTLRHLVERLPVMIAPEVKASVGQDVQIGGPDVLTSGCGSGSSRCR